MARAVTATVTTPSTAFKFMPCQLYHQYSPSDVGRILNEGVSSRAIGTDYLETASQEFKTNDMVNIVSGAIKQVLTADALPIAGFALEDATNLATPTAYPRVMTVNSRNVYVMSAWSATSTSTNKADMIALVGTRKNLCQTVWTDSNGSISYGTVVDLDSAAAVARVKIVGVYSDPTITATTTYVPVLVQFEDIVLDAAGTALVCPGLQF